MIDFNHHKRPETLEELERFEEMIEERLPNDYREFLLTNGGGLSPKGYYAFKITKPGVLVNSDFHEEVLLEYLSSAAIIDNNKSDLMMHYLNLNSFEREFSYLPSDMISIGDGAGGGLILLGIKGGRKGKVYFWDANLFPAEDDNPETYDNISFVANSFDVFLNMLYPFDDE